MMVWRNAVYAIGALAAIFLTSSVLSSLSNFGITPPQRYGSASSQADGEWKRTAAARPNAESGSRSRKDRKTGARPEETTEPSERENSTEERGSVDGVDTGLGRDAWSHSEAPPLDGRENTKPDHEFAFTLLPPASMSYRDVEPCPGTEPAVEDLHTLHPGANMLITIGVQKGGTTWMASALTQHPAIITANYAYNKPKFKTKEVHYFDHWPHRNGSEAEYVEAYDKRTMAAATANATQQLEAAGVPLETLQSPAGVREAYKHLTHEVAFSDPSPDYVGTPHVVPRMSYITPHARLVLVLRDPVARALSSYSMDRGRYCKSKKTALYAVRNELCTDTAFADTVEASTGVEARVEHGTCAFDGLDGGELQTWHDCFKCYYMYVNETYCSELPQPQPFDGCNPRALNYVQRSNYAAQIAWWLAFFPPEQILILTSAELADPDRQIKALNRVLDHAQLPNARRFTREWLDSMTVDGFEGKYKSIDKVKGIPEATQTLRERFKRPLEDLRHLINFYWPHMNFSGLEEEEV